MRADLHPAIWKIIVTGAKILVVEDDTYLTQTIGHLLRLSGFEAVIAHTAEDGYLQAQNFHPDLILLDVMVPNMGGWELCKKLRTLTAVPIIFMTALGNPEDIVKGLNLGADDYIPKPFENDVLIARMRAHLRRSGGAQADELVFGEGEIRINIAGFQIFVRGEEVEFTPREFELLSILARNHGRVIRTSELLEQAWGSNYADSKDNIKPYIHYLRKKIERDPAAPEWIITVRGIGYRFGGE